eukprot:CAMPEP_0114981348 /NCGR_PEP_ID=MMETSP0216-20121206/5494_1 /TAXON_ID=223996 /ORGANISM="Protocruzia adherens, Strain Boccale" /LENGTH=318 /DNA_ID=CAMNT_0002343009 /DNA_START=4205 /DNA_END=5161 /DNA_ORIENTATION=-
MWRKSGLGRSLRSKLKSTSVWNFKPHNFSNVTSISPLSTSDDRSNEENNRNKNLFSLAALLLSTYTLTSHTTQSESAQTNTTEEEKEPWEGIFYTKAEVRKHRTKETGIWITYHGLVYDITKFVDLHPGGSSKLMLVAGGALEPFWAFYTFHNRSEISRMIDKYCIGEVDPDEEPEMLSDDDPFAHEPDRHPALKVNSWQPFNAETPSELLADKFVTPSDLLYVRNHLPVPVIDENDYRLEISGDGMYSVRLSMKDLKKMKKHNVVVTLQCAGNRRNDMKKVREVKGLDWEQGAIGTAKWTGVRLIDVLQQIGFDLSK